MNRIPALVAIASLASALAASELPAPAFPLPEHVQSAVPDLQVEQPPAHVRLKGWVGARLDASEANRLKRIDPPRLLEGFLKRPGRQAWDGEHAGKWIHAATLSWAGSGDPELRALLDKVVTMLIDCQLEDGYLGTYLPAEYWTEWDVWVHKYNLIGLLAYHRYTGDARALTAARRAADLLVRVFGDGPGQRDVMVAGHFAGMAPMSVLEPMATLYRFTGEPRYLEFCRYLVRASEGATGPALVSMLRESGRVTDARSNKAYEMLTTINGLVEMYRTTGDRPLLEAALAVWDDVTTRRLYPTGAASYRELFRGHDDFPNSDDIGETCVAVSWYQLNSHLLRLTGEARFADEIERVLLNHLLAAQLPDGTGWCYFTPPQFLKTATTAPEVSCCFSSGPRSLALAPTLAVTTDSEGVVVNLYETLSAQLTPRGGPPVSLRVETGYPFEGSIRLVLAPAQPARFTLKLRVPAWAEGASVAINGVPQSTIHAGGYLALTRTWSGDEKVALNLPLSLRVVSGTRQNTGAAMLHWGPLVLAADETLLPKPGGNAWQVCLLSHDPAQLDWRIEPATGTARTWPGAQLFHVRGGLRVTEGASMTIQPIDLPLVPFGDAGASGGAYRTWFPLPQTLETRNVLAEGTVTATTATEDLRKCVDGELTTTAVMRGAPVPGEHGFDVVLPRPMTIKRLTFSHGVAWGPGGWFDASAGKPRFEFRRTADGPWELAGPLAGYPATTATQGGAIRTELEKSLRITSDEAARMSARHTYSVVLPAPVNVVAVRVRGQPSMPDTAGRGELKCAEIQAFAE